MDDNRNAERKTQGSREAKHGMTTAQLVVLWYAVLVIALILVIAASGADDPTVLAILAVLTVAAALIYTMRPHANVKKHKVALLVLIPVCGISLVLATILGIMSWRRSRTERGEPAWDDAKFLEVGRGKVEVFDLKLEWYRAGRQNSLSGRLKNNSDRTICAVSMTIDLYNRDSKKVDSGVGVGNCTIRPGETGSFSGYARDLVPPVVRMSGYRIGDWYYDPYTDMSERVECTWRFSNLVPYAKE